MSNTLKTLIFVLLTYHVYGTQYLPLSMEKQLESADGVVRAKFRGSDFKKDREGIVVTESSFELISSSGLGANDLLNKKAFKVTYPGGQWDGVTYHIPGGPKFKKGEEVVLLLTDTTGGFVLQNFGLGKYNLFKEDGQTYLSSSVFKENPQLGRISLKKFSGLLKSKFGEGLESVNKKRFVNVPQKDVNSASGRTIASEKQGTRNPASDMNQTSNNKSSFNFFWLTIILSTLGVIFFLITRSNEE